MQWILNFARHFRIFASENQTSWYTFASGLKCLGRHLANYLVQTLCGMRQIISRLCIKKTLWYDCDVYN